MAIVQKPSDKHSALENRLLTLRPMTARISIVDAVSRTAIDLGVSFAAAKLKLIEACVAGLIRAFWRGHASRLSPAIARTDWTGADVDLRHEVMILANGERRALIDLDRKEFEELLQDAVTVAQTADKKTRGRRWKRDLASEAVKAKFPDGEPNPLLTTSQIVGQARNWLEENHPLEADKISDDTIRTAAGRK